MADSQIIPITKDTVGDMPLSEAERQAAYELLCDLRDDVLSDPGAPPLSDLFAVLQFVGRDDDPGFDLDGGLMERKHMGDLPPDVQEMVDKLPAAEGQCWLTVIYHPQGIGVFQVRIPEARPTLEAVPASSAPSSIDALHEQLSKYMGLLPKQCDMLAMAVEGAVQQWRGLPDIRPSHEMVAVVNIEDDGSVHGGLIGYSKLLQVAGEPIRGALTAHTGRVPGQMLVLLGGTSGKGGVFSIAVDDVPPLQQVPVVNTKGTSGVLH